MQRRLSLVVLALVSLTLSGCAPLLQQKPVLDPELSWSQRQNQLADLTQWQFKGRTVIRQGNEAWNAGLKWQQVDHEFDIKLSGPFALGGVLLKGDNQHVVLTMNDGSQLMASSPEALLEQALDVNMPVSALRDWVRGLPDHRQAVDDVVLDEQGRITRLQQGDWEIKYLRYLTFQQYQMPGKIFIEHPDLSLKLIISDWDPVK